MGWRARRARPGKDRARNPALLGVLTVQALRLPERVSTGRRRSGTRRLHTTHEFAEYDGADFALALVRQPRILPRLQRQTAAPGRTRAVRLRAPAINGQFVDFGRTDDVRR